MTDPFVGQLTFFRVYSGHLDAGHRRLQRDQGDERAHRPPPEDARQQARGDQGGLGRRHRAPPSASRTSPPATRSATRTQPVVLEAMNFPEPVIAVAIEPKTKADQEKLGMALGKLMQEDPTFRVHTDEETGQTIISRHGRAAPRDHRRPPGARVQGRGQRRQAAGRLPRDDHARRRKGEGRFIRQTGGRGQYGHVQDPHRAAPRTARTSCSRTRSSAASIPKEFIQPIEQGIKEALERGVLAGYPMTDVKVELYDGSYHDVDSSEMAFKIAGSMAFQDARQEGAARSSSSRS